MIPYLTVRRKCLNWETIPEGDWFCFNCEEEHKVNNAPVSSKHKESMPAAKQQKKWGGGLACAGRSTVCNIVGQVPSLCKDRVYDMRFGVAFA